MNKISLIMITCLALPFIVATNKSPVKKVNTIKKESIVNLTNNETSIYTDNKYGKIINNLTLQKYSSDENNQSDLYFLINNTEFQPGAALYSAGYKNYFADALNHKGFIKTRLRLQYVAAPTYKPDLLVRSSYIHHETFPLKTNSYSTTITSGFNANYNLGVSTASGFETGGSIGISYSKSVTTNSPALTSLNTTDLDNVSINGSNHEYFYDISMPDVYHLQSGMIFEIKRYPNLLLTVETTLSMTSYQDHFWNWEQELYDVGPNISTHTYNL